MREIDLPPQGGRIGIRKALAFYFVRALRFVNLDIPDRGRRYVCTNADEIRRTIGGFEPKETRKSSEKPVKNDSKGKS